jgi:hypothetical protein
MGSGTHGLICLLKVQRVLLKKVARLFHHAAMKKAGSFFLIERRLSERLAETASVG